MGYVSDTQEIAMRHKLAMAALAALVSAPTIMPEAALARHHHYVYRGHTRYYRSGCGGGDGFFGTVVGGGGGAFLWHALGGGTGGTIAGGVGGGPLGPHPDKKKNQGRGPC